MSQFKVEVVEVGAIDKHPNADSLGIVKIFGFPVITRLGEFQPGDKAAYVPVESVVPDTEQWAFLGGHRRIKAKKLRGIFSMGLLVPAPEGAEVEQDVAEAMGITKYEPPEHGAPNTCHGPGLHSEPNPGWIPRYTDIDHFRRYNHVLVESEPIVVMEKIHGCNAVFCHDGERLWVGSHRELKAPGTSNDWRRIAEAMHLEERLVGFPTLIFFGEVYGWVQDLKYGHKPGDVSVRFFDVYDREAGRFLDWDAAQAILQSVPSFGLPAVPCVYEGPYQGVEHITELAQGKSILADNIREGVVVRPAVERFDHRVGRVILKIHSEAYLLRKNGTEAR